MMNFTLSLEVFTQSFIVAVNEVLLGKGNNQAILNSTVTTITPNLIRMLIEERMHNQLKKLIVYTSKIWKN